MSDKNIQKYFYDKAFAKGHIWQDTDFSVSSRYLHERFLNLVIKKNTQNILEIGCGNGLLTFFLLKRSIEVIALDISEKAIENLKNQFSKEISQGKLNLECAELIDFLEKSEEKFDVIIGSGVMHHIAENNRDKLFKLVYDKLNPGGVFACAPEPNAGGIYQIIWHWAKFFYKLFGITYDSEVEKGTFSMIPGRIRLALLRADFSKVEILPFQSIPYFHLSILAYLDRLILDRISGRLAMYIIIKGEKSLSADQTTI